MGFKSHLYGIEMTGGEGGRPHDLARLNRTFMELK